MKKLIIIVIVLILSSMSSYATLITFDDKTEFLSQTGAVSTETLPNIGMVPPGNNTATLTVGDLTFSITEDSREFFCGASPGHLLTDDWTPELAGNEIAISGPEHLNIELDSPVYSFGFEFFEMQYNNPNGVGIEFVDSTFEVFLFSNGSFIDSFTFNVPNDIAAFVGAWSDTCFDYIEIREIVGGNGDEYYGQFYTGTNPVPEPATLLLLGTGLIGLAGARRKMKK